jgi:Conserved region in glutamate synthase
MYQLMGEFKIEKMAIRYSQFVPQLCNYCLSLGFERKKKMMPSQAFCSDETQGYPAILLAQHFGTFPFDHGQVGGRVATDRNGPHAHHGEDLSIVQASHVGYDPSSRRLGFISDNGRNRRNLAPGRIRLGASGKIVSAFDMVRAIALGADWRNSARGFMFALGCIQSQSCHTDRCPTGVATQDRSRQRALVVSDKATRVANFHRSTLQSLAELTSAAGLERPSQFARDHISRRISPLEVVTYAHLYPAMSEGELLGGTDNLRFQKAWLTANPHSFRPN